MLGVCSLHSLQSRRRGIADAEIKVPLSPFAENPKVPEGLYLKPGVGQNTPLYISPTILPFWSIQLHFRAVHFLLPDDVCC